MSHIHDLIEASSLGTPHAKRMRTQESARAAANLTGMPEEQADWDLCDFCALYEGAVCEPCGIEPPEQGAA